MSDKGTKKWPLYILLFLMLWAGNVAISLASRLPAQYVMAVVLREAIVPALIALVLCMVHLSASRRKK
jgi:hypothetical protein